MTKKPVKNKNPKGVMGRPKGTTQYPEGAKVDQSHHMSSLAHAFIRDNKKQIERQAREPHFVQWKLF